MDEAGPGQPLETFGVVLNYAIWTAFVVEAVTMPEESTTPDLVEPSAGEIDRGPGRLARPVLRQKGN
jgi:hypothetical protein